MLKIGEPAPDFSTIAYSPVEDSIVKADLKDYRGKWLIMSFHPGDFTFTCATDLREFQNILPVLKENNCEMVGVSIDSVYVHKMWIKTSPAMKDVKYLLLDDSNQAMHRDYGALAESGQIADAERITVIVNPDGIVEYVEKANPRIGKRPTNILSMFLGLKFLYAHQSDTKFIIILPAEWKSPEEDALTVKIPHDVGMI
ncbi:MAG: redoxin domain-containing protein [Candidatus Marsarchaeota archaeon]|nr:redoxin domain-containing protein [Candidatus Marsarchaeota archaeon]MCL5106317.1 redoxin domain-containing protein [Candidatus Marsarchaeota archaeon]